MKVNNEVLKQLFPTFEVAPVAAQPGVAKAIQSQAAVKAPAKYEPILVGNGYEWSDKTHAYHLGDQIIYYFDPGQMFLWVWAGALFRTLKGTEKLSKWVQGDEKYPEGKANTFMGTYKQMTGQGDEGGGTAVAEPGEETNEPEPEMDRAVGGGDVSFSGTGGRPGDFDPKPVDPTDALIIQLTKKAGPKKTLPSDLMIDLGLKAKKDKNEKLLKFLSTIKPLGENVIKQSDLNALIKEIVKVVTKEAWDQPQREQPYDEKWVEDWANKIWPDPMDIGRGGIKWRLTKSKRAKTGERVYMLSKTQQVTRNRFLVNRGTKWYYLDEKPDHTKKWVEVPADSVPVPDHKPEDEEELQEDGGAGAAGPGGMTTTANVSPVTGPRAFKKRHGEGLEPLGGMEEEQIDEMTTTDGGTSGYNIPGAFSRAGGSKAGVAGSEALGYTLTNVGKKDMKLKADKLYESIKSMKTDLRKMLDEGTKDGPICRHCKKPLVYAGQIACPNCGKPQGEKRSGEESHAKKFATKTSGTSPLDIGPLQ